MLNKASSCLCALFFLVHQKPIYTKTSASVKIRLLQFIKKIFLFFVVGVLRSSDLYQNFNSKKIVNIGVEGSILILNSDG